MTIKKHPPLSIFRAGRHTDMNGVEVNLSETDLQAIAAAYNHALHSAPLVIGHPATNHPAYGWVQSLMVNNGILQAIPQQVDPAFAELVTAGRYKKISASFYPPKSPGNPKPGVYYLRHVGFLGATAPAVKGLPDAQFKEGEEGVVCFEFMDQQVKSTGEEGKNMTDSTSEANAGIMKKIEESLATLSSKFGDLVTLLTKKEEATKPPSEESDAEKKLKEMEKSFSEKEAQLAELKGQQKKTAVTAFAETLEKAGKILPREKSAVVALLAGMDGVGEISFAEGDKTVKSSPGDALKKLLEGLPQRVVYQEKSAPGDETAAVSFAAPQGFSVNQSRLELHSKALAYADAHKVDYATAAIAVSQQGGQ